MAGEETAVGTTNNWDAELEHSRQTAWQLMDTLARKVGASRAVRYVKTHSAREMASEVTVAAGRRPVYALAAAVAAGFLVGWALKRSLRPRVGLFS